MSHAKRGPGHRPHRTPRAAHRRSREDRHVHRAAAAARRRAHHHHDPLPARRRTPVLRPGGQRRLDRPAQDRRHRPARPHPGHRARRRGRRGRPARHPDQQRVPDGAPYARAPTRRWSTPSSRPLPTDITLPEIVSFDRISEAHPAALAGTLQQHAVAHHETPAHTPASITALALQAGNASLEAHLAGTAVDAGGLLPDLQTTNSWTQTVDQVDPLELLEVQLCNATAPFLLISRLRASMRASTRTPDLRRQRVGDGGSVRPSLQGRRPPAHQHGQGVAQHADPHQCGRDVRVRPHPDERRRHRLDHRRATPPGEAAGSRPRAGTRRSTWSTARPGSTTRSCAARPARTSTATS